ncbi:MAG: methyltransferase domain-containing protein [Clostridia bacterium]|nr:methyltransferase domain-containing protein [Clostridia bacterium]
MINYFYDCYSVLNKVYSDGKFIKQAILDTPMELKNKPLTIKTCYGVLDKDIELSYYLSFLAPKSPKLVIRTILKIAMYNIKYLGKKDYAVVKNAVELTKKLGKGGTSGFVNAFLRKFLQTDILLPKNNNEYLSVKYSFPLFAVDELIKTYGIERTEKIVSFENTKNTLVFYEADGEKYLKEKSVNYSLTSFKNVFFVENFVRNEDFDKGIYTYQSIGSIAICDIVEPCDKILDCCSAPGGKSIRLSYKCKNVYATDIYPHRVQLIESYVKRMGRNNIKTFVADSKEYNSEYKDYFDAVLCDSPCSGLGVVNENPDIKLNRTFDNIISLNKEQLAILNNVSKYVKKGGYLYYSTCSILDCENIEIVNKFLKSNSNYKLEKIDSKLLHEDKNGANQFLPDISGVGFFVAKLKREN